MLIPLGFWAASGGVAYNGAYEQIATQLVTASSATLTFSAIPSIYKHLEVRFTCKSSGGSLPLDIQMLLNSQTTNYAFHQLTGDGSSVSSFGLSNFDKIPLFNASISSGDSRYGAGIVSILDYASSVKNKTTRSLHGVFGDSSNRHIVLSSGFLNSTSAITSITFSANGGGSRTIEPGSRFSLYGIRG